MDSIPDNNNTMSEEYVNSITHHVKSISSIQERQQSLAADTLCKKKTLTDITEATGNDSVIGSITQDEKVNLANLTFGGKKFTEDMEQTLNKSQAHREELEAIFSKFKGSGSGSNQFTENITQLILEYQDFVSSISLIQKLTLINMLTGVLILNCLLTLIAVFYGESLIIYFNLENKFPRLTKFIKLRSKFQQFYFFVNSIIIIIAIVAMIYANYLMFILAN